ncbi:MAG: EamA family transporter [Rhizobiales bacterium]|nr:EamA family transporter [Hyphomicrobiales bacterium]
MTIVDAGARAAPSGGSAARSVLLMLVGMALMIVNDTLTKLASERLATGQIMTIRGLIATTVMLIVAWRSGLFGRLGGMLDPMAALRTISEAIGAALFLTALFRMPIANVIGIMQVVPLAVTAGAALVLAEPVGWRRWLAALIGFLGALMIVQPGLEAFDWGAIYVLGAVLCVAVRDLATRLVAPGVPTTVMTLAAAAAVMVVGITFKPLETWPMPTWREMAILTAAAGLLMVAYATIIQATRSAPAALVAPYRYSLVVWALLSGWLVWGQLPNVLASVGIAVVVAAGLYTFARERQRGGGPTTDGGAR